MKYIAVLFIAAVSAFAADAPKEKADAPPVLTAADREPYHEAQEALQADQTQALLGQQAAGRLADREKAVEAAAKVLLGKCGAWGMVRDTAGRAQCGTTKTEAPAKK